MQADCHIRAEPDVHQLVVSESYLKLDIICEYNILLLFHLLWRFRANNCPFCMRITGGQPSLTFIPVTFILMLNTTIFMRVGELSRGDKFRKSTQIQFWRIRKKPEWFDLKSHYPCKVHLCILVVFNEKGQMVVDKIFFILALQKDWEVLIQALIKSWNVYHINFEYQQVITSVYWPFTPTWNPCWYTVVDSWSSLLRGTTSGRLSRIL